MAAIDNRRPLLKGLYKFNSPKKRKKTQISNIPTSAVLTLSDIRKFKSSGNDLV